MLCIDRPIEDLEPRISSVSGSEVTQKMDNSAIAGCEAFTSTGSDTTTIHTELATPVSVCKYQKHVQGQDHEYFNPYKASPKDVKNAAAYPEPAHSNNHRPVTTMDSPTPAMPVCSGREPRSMPDISWGDWNEFEIDNAARHYSPADSVEALLSNNLLLQQPAFLNDNLSLQGDFSYHTPQCMSCGDDVLELRKIRSGDSDCALTSTSTRLSDDLIATPYAWSAEANVPFPASGYIPWASTDLVMHEQAQQNHHVLQAQEHLNSQRITKKHIHSTTHDWQPYEGFHGLHSGHEHEMSMAFQPRNTSCPEPLKYNTGLGVSSASETYRFRDQTSSPDHACEGGSNKDVVPLTRPKTSYPALNPHTDPFFTIAGGSWRETPPATSKPYNSLPDHNQMWIPRPSRPLSKFLTDTVHTGQLSLRADDPGPNATVSPSTRFSDSMSREDRLLLSYRKEGMSYKQIKAICGFAEAESTLRGRHRNLTKHRKDRLRKPKWTAHDISVLKHTVAQYLPRIPPHSGLHSSTRFPQADERLRLEDLGKVSWKHVAEEMKKLGCYQYGNATVKKKYLEVMGIKTTHL